MEDHIDFIDAEKLHTILVVEDHIPDQTLIKLRIQSIWPHYDVTFVNSLHEAYAMLEFKKFDLILLDLNLPDGFGPHSVQDVREHSKHVPIIVMTSMLSSLTADESIKLGADGILSKNKIMDESFYNIIQQNISC